MMSPECTLSNFLIKVIYNHRAFNIGHNMQLKYFLIPFQNLIIFGEFYYLTKLDHFQADTNQDHGGAFLIILVQL